MSSRWLALRFGVIFGVLWALPFPLTVAPWFGDEISQLWEKLWEPLVDAFGQNTFGTDPIHFLETGSGDTTFLWVQTALFLLLAAIGTAVWSYFDRRRGPSPRLAFAGRTGLRYVLAVTMMYYGFAKLLLTQFPAPSPYVLYEQVGHKSPMGLLWTFMGASPGYNLFTGGGELLGAVLLLWRRTTTLGALVLIAVLANVVVLNFCYDVPVKLFSTELLLGAFLLAAPAARRLSAVVLGRAAPAAAPDPEMPRWWQRARPWAKYLLIAMAVFEEGRNELEARTQRAVVDPLYGAWQVDRFVRDDRELPPLVGDDTRWRMLFVGNYGSTIVRTMTDRDQFFHVDKERPADQLVLGDDHFTVRRLDDQHAMLEGTFDKHRLRIELHVVDDKDMQLVHRGFHWVQEFPYNR